MERKKVMANREEFLKALAEASLPHEKLLSILEEVDAVEKVAKETGRRIEDIKYTAIDMTDIHPAIGYAFNIIVEAAVAMSSDMEYEELVPKIHKLIRELSHREISDVFLTMAVEFVRLFNKTHVDERIEQLITERVKEIKEMGF